MARRTTHDHATIRRWVEERGGQPARVRGTADVLRIAFGPPPPNWELIDWPTFFAAFDRAGLTLLYEETPGSRIVKLVKGRDEGGPGPSPSGDPPPP